MMVYIGWGIYIEANVVSPFSEMGKALRISPNGFFLNDRQLYHDNICYLISSIALNNYINIIL